MAVEAASIIPVFFLGETKGLISEEIKPSNVPGGDKRDRTADLLNAIQALSRINGTPISTSLYKTRYRTLLKRLFL